MTAALLKLSSNLFILAGHFNIFAGVFCPEVMDDALFALFLSIIYLLVSV